MTEAHIGDIMYVDNTYYEVVDIDSDTELSLDIEAGATATDATYLLIQDVNWASNLYLLNKMEEFLRDRNVSLNEMRNWMAGTKTGGPNEDGYYPLTDRYGQVHMTACPALVSDSTATGQATAAEQSAQQAAASAVLAEDWAGSPVDEEVVAGKFSALHWATKAARLVKAADNLPHLVVQIAITQQTVRVDFPSNRYTINDPIVIVTVMGAPTDVSMTYPSEFVEGVGEVHTHVSLTFDAEAVGKKANIWVTGQ